MTATASKAVTALYLRISQDDGSQDVSNSIANQRDLLSAYVAADPVLSASEVLVFADDGWSGTNFERPQAKRLLGLVRSGGVQNIVVKDLSRWGRNYPEVSEHLDQIFPFLGVRFISVNDQYDSAGHKGQTAPMDVAFSSIAHDIYSKELSVKVKQAYLAKAKKGEYVCGTVPYGFVRPKKGNNRLLIDEAAAAVIRRIFDMAGAGMKRTKIAAVLNGEGIDSPLEHRRRNGRSTLALRPKAGRSFWDSSAIYRILNDERYAGTLVCFKSERVSRNAAAGKRGEKKLPKEDWVKVPDALPAIVSAEQFEKAQAHRRKMNCGGEAASRSPFVGKVICGHCNRSLRLSRTKSPFFRCEGAKLNAGLGCYDGKVRASALEKILLEAVKLEATKVLDLSELQQLQQKTRKLGSSERDGILAEIKRLAAAVSSLERRSMTLYEEFADGKIGRDAYLAAKVSNIAKIESSRYRIAELNHKLAVLEDEIDVQPSVADESVLRRLLSATEATGEVMSLVGRIVVFDSRRLEVRFAFGDGLPQVMGNVQ